MGFEPYPGTLNLRISREDSLFLQHASKKGKRLEPPDPEFCEARMLSAKVGRMRVAAIFPDEGVWVHGDTLELVAPTSIRESMGLGDGDELQVEIERPFEPRAVIFDIDGTLIDSFEVYWAAINEIFQRVGLPPVERGVVREVMREGVDPWNALIPRDLPNRDELVARCKEEDKKSFLSLYREKARLFPTAVPVITTLEAKGYRVGYVTSGWGKEKISGVLEKGGATDLIKDVLCSLDIEHPRPAPDLLLECSKRLGVEVWDSVYVGDSPIDIRMGKAARMATIGVLTGVGTRDDFVKEGADAVIGDLSELLAALESRDGDLVD